VLRVLLRVRPRRALRRAISARLVNAATISGSFGALSASDTEVATNPVSISASLQFVASAVILWPVFVPPKNPQYPLDIQIKPRLLSPQFGAGYPTFAPDGINTMLRQVSLKFSVLQESDFASIDTFISSNIQKPFYYQLPDETQPRLFLMTGRTRRFLSTTYDYEVTLQEQPVL
jgi:phage-related protein